MSRNSPVVLVVDDDPFIRSMLSQILTSMGIGCETAEAAEDALLRINRREIMPDLLFLDFMLPKMNGMEFLRRLRAMDGGAYTPVVVLSGRKSKELVTEAVHLKCRDVLFKPLQPEMIRLRLSCLTTVLNIAGAREVISSCSGVPDPTLLEDGGFQRFRNKAYLAYLAHVAGREFVLLADEGFRSEVLLRLDEDTLSIVCSIYLRESAWIPVWPHESSKLGVKGALPDGQVSLEDPNLQNLLKSL